LQVDFDIVVFGQIGVGPLFVTFVDHTVVAAAAAGAAYKLRLPGAVEVADELTLGSLLAWGKGTAKGHNRSVGRGQRGKMCTRMKTTQINRHHNHNSSLIWCCVNVNVHVFFINFVSASEFDSSLLSSVASAWVLLFLFSVCLFMLLLPSLPLLLCPSCDCLTLSRCRGAQAPIPPA